MQKLQRICFHLKQWCFNLFDSLNKDKLLLIKLLNDLLKINTKEIIGEIEIEYTPPGEILKEQTGKTDVDCDAFIWDRYAGAL